MNNSNWRDSSDWKENPPTLKQMKLVHALITKAMSKMNRGQVSDFIETMMRYKFAHEDETDTENQLQTRESEGDYEELLEDLKKKNRSWKWKEDLK